MRWMILIEYVVKGGTKLDELYFTTRKDMRESNKRFRKHGTNVIDTMMVDMEAANA